MSEVSPIRILVVEDNQANALLASRQLEKLGLDATVAPNREEALKQLEQAPGFALVLMDLHIGADDGLELAKEIRRADAGSRARLPIIAMTASATERDRDLAAAAGMDGFLSKPVLLETLAYELGSWIPLAHVPDRQRAAPSTTGGGSDAQILDPTLIADMRRELGESTARRFVETYAGELRGRVTAIRDAVIADDPPAIERAAHVLRSPSDAIGLRALAGLCARLEELARGPAASASGFAELLGEIEAVVVPTERALDDVLGELGSSSG
ncbi:MAG: response regulator [Actinomycetota bacterium]